MMTKILRDSFLDVSYSCLKKAKKLYGIKEASLIKGAEKAVFIGVNYTDAQESEILTIYFNNLRKAFRDYLDFYINSDYVFVLEDSLLIDLFPVHTSVRGITVQYWKSNLIAWEKLSFAEKDVIKDDRIAKLIYA